MARRFQLVDVFGEYPFSGNPLAVVLDSEGLSSEEMQAIACWLNLSETTFLLPPTTDAADYQVRIFTLTQEIPFAGHPTLGSCHAWLAAGGTPRNPEVIVQECGAGLISIRRDGDMLAFAAPPLLRGGPVDEALIQELALFLQIERSRIIDAQWADNGPGWVAVLLGSADEALALNPRRDWPVHIDLGVVGLYPPGSAIACEIRAFFSNQHLVVIEDPVTGSLNASVAQWLLSSGRISAPYIAAQGTAMGRSGRISITRDAAGAVWVGGKTMTLFAGTGDF